MPLRVIEMIRGSSEDRHGFSLTLVAEMKEAVMIISAINGCASHLHVHCEVETRPSDRIRTSRAAMCCGIQ